MSGIFDLDPDRQRRLDEDARLNPLDLTAEPILDKWEGSGQALKGLTRPAASMLRTAAMVGPLTPGVGTARTLMGDEAFDRAYYRDVLGWTQDVVDANTPDAASMGSAAKALSTVNQAAGSLPFLFASPPAFLTDSAVSPATDLIDQGVDATTATVVGEVNLAANAVGLKLPNAVGSTIATRVASGAGINVAAGAATDAASKGVLQAGGYEDQAQGYNATDPYARGLELLLGAAFPFAEGSRLPPAQRDAVLAARNADSFTRRSMPGEPATRTADVAHVDAISDTIRKLAAGEPVDVSGVVRAEDFKLRPEVAPAPVSTVAPDDYGRMLVALESGGKADAKAPTSSATGLHQFTADTWKRMVATAKPAWAEGLTDAQLLDARKDPAKSAQMEQALRAENARALEAAGQAATPFNLYAAHHFGAGGGVKFARASDATPMADILTPAQLKANPYLKGKTKGEAIANWTQRAESAGVDITADLPNFGLAEVPRTVPDGDPLLTDTSTLEGRDALRTDLVAQHFTDAAPRALGEGERPIAYVMGGGGASGKGTILRSLTEAGEVPAHGAVHIDPDRIKTGGGGVAGIPEYKALHGRGDGRAARVVHEESSVVATEVLRQAMAGKYDVVLDRTLGDPAKGMAELQALKDAGYEVRLYGVTVDPKTAVQRAVKRANGSGRHVPLDSLLKAHRGFAGAFEDYARLADSARLYDNSGAAPLPIAAALQGKLAIGNPEAYTAFRGRSTINAEATTYRALQAGSPGADGAGAGQHDARAVRGRDQAPAGRGNGTGQDVRQDAPAGLTPETPAAAAQRLAADSPHTSIIDGYDGDGTPRYRPLSEVVADIEAERQQAARDAEAFPAAVNCYLRRGDAP